MVDSIINVVGKKNWIKNVKNKIKITQRKNNEKIKIPWKKEKHRIICCDCGLVHDLDFEVVGENIIMRAFRMEKETEDWRTKNNVSDDSSTNYRSRKRCRNK